MRLVIELFAFATDLLATTEIALNNMLKRAKLNAEGVSGAQTTHPPSHKTKAHRDCILKSMPNFIQQSLSRMYFSAIHPVFHLAIHIHIHILYWHIFTSHMHTVLE